MSKVNFHKKVLLYYSEKNDGNIDPKFGEAPQVKKNRQGIYLTLGLHASQMIEAEQIHFNRILTLTKDNSKMWRGQKVTGVDGFVTDDPEIAMLIRVADCIPLCFYDPAHSSLALIHAGWKGVVLGIHTEALQRLVSVYQTNPRECLVWFGPSAKNCCYTLDTLPEPMQSAAWKSFIKRRQGKFIIDLTGYVAETLHEQGILKKNMLFDPRCTVDDQNLFSHQRAVNTGEPEGRIAVIAKLND